MTAAFFLDIVTPERVLSSSKVDMVVVPGADGDFGVLSGHAPIISSVRPGVIRVYEGNTVVKKYLISGGIAEVNQEKCTVLATEAYDFTDVNKDVIEQRLFELRRQHEKADMADKSEELDILENTFSAFVREVDEASH
jgi:F-type H+-transporting ATPase subunit epsilon